MNHKYFNINEPGYSIRCKQYYTDRSPVGKAVICFTGFAGHKDNGAAEKFAEKLLSKSKDVNVFVFNWPSHGDDARKKLTLDDCSVYIKLVTDTLKTKFAVRELYAYATSFGGYLVLKYIIEHGSPFEKIALRCPAVDMYDVLTRTIMKSDDFDRIMKGENIQIGFDRKIIVTRELLLEMKTNDIRQYDYLNESERILILHGTEDEVVPFDSVRTFADDNLIEFIPIEGADHRFVNPVHMSLANKYVMQFFDFQ